MSAATPQRPPTPRLNALLRELFIHFLAPLLLGLLGLFLDQAARLLAFAATAFTRAAVPPDPAPPPSSADVPASAALPATPRRTRPDLHRPAAENPEPALSKSTPVPDTPLPTPAPTTHTPASENRSPAPAAPLAATLAIFGHVASPSPAPRAPDTAPKPPPSPLPKNNLPCGDGRPPTAPAKACAPVSPAAATAVDDVLRSAPENARPAESPNPAATAPLASTLAIFGHVASSPADVGVPDATPSPPSDAILNKGGLGGGDRRPARPVNSAHATVSPLAVATTKAAPHCAGKDVFPVIENVSRASQGPDTVPSNRNPPIGKSPAAAPLAATLAIFGHVASPPADAGIPDVSPSPAPRSSPSTALNKARSAGDDRLRAAIDARHAHSDHSITPSAAISTSAAELSPTFSAAPKRPDLDSGDRVAATVDLLSASSSHTVASVAVASRPPAAPGSTLKKLQSGDDYLAPAVLATSPASSRPTASSPVVPDALSIPEPSIAPKEPHLGGGDPPAAAFEAAPASFGHIIVSQASANTVDVERSSCPLPLAAPPPSLVAPLPPLGSPHRPALSSLVALRIGIYENLGAGASPDSTPLPPKTLPSPTNAAPPARWPPSSPESSAPIATPRPTAPLRSPAHARSGASGTLRRIGTTSSGCSDRRFEDGDDDDIGDTQSLCAVLDGPQQRLEKSESCCVTSSPSTGGTTMAKPAQINATEAPLGVESLQELIPEVIPEEVRDEIPETALPTAVPKVDSQLFSPAGPVEMPEITLDGNDDGIIPVESMEQFPAFRVPRRGSNTSLQTESYSSPDSPVQSSPLLSSSQGRHRKSWHPSDHDLFSEEPMMVCDDMEGSGLSRSRRSNRSESSSLVDGTRFEHALVEDYDSAGMIVSVRSRRSSSSDDNVISASTPVTNPSDGNSWPNRFADIDDVADRRRPAKSAKSKKGVPENLLFRQASADVATMDSPFSFDRPRSGLEGSRVVKPRFSPSRLSSKAPSASKGDRRRPPHLVGRSVSNCDDRFEDWPEYGPPRDEEMRMSRRHVSDMSFGVKARKKDMLPVELLNEDQRPDTGFIGTGSDIPARFGGTGRGRKKRFGLSANSRETSDVKGVMRILRRRRKLSSLEETFGAGTAAAETSHHRPGRRSGSGERGFKFELELTQDTIFSLLNRICPECGFNITIKKPNHKMKIEIPWDAEGRPLLASIVLTRLSQGRSTFISITRSKEDQSGGPSRDIEAAGILLRKRLASHVEFIEDSFASLHLEESTVDLYEKRIGGRREG